MPFPQSPVQPATGLAPGLNLAINDLQGPTSYTTGGVTVSANKFGLQSLKYLHSMDLTQSGNFFIKVVSPIGFGKPTVLVKWFVQATGAEVANTTNLSAEFIRCLGLGI